MTLQEYIISYTERGECRCGQCMDVGNKPDPTGIHTVDTGFFKVKMRDGADADALRFHIGRHKPAFGSLDVFDGREYNFMQVGAWLGGQELALRFMALGHLLGVFQLLTPRLVLGDKIPDDIVQQALGAGMVTIVADKKKEAQDVKL